MTSLSPIAGILATLAVLAFLMTAAGFLALAWRSGWAVGRFAGTAADVAKSLQELIGMFRQFVETQGKRNDEFELALQVQAERLNTLIERQATNV